MCSQKKEKKIGLVFLRYIKDAIILQYIVASIDSDEASLNSFRFDAIDVVMALQSIIPNLFRIYTAYFPCPREIPVDTERGGESVCNQF